MQFLARSDSSVPLSAPQVILSLVSHKALRWMSPAFALILFATSLVLTGTGVYHQYRAVWLTASLIMVFGLLGTLPGLRRIQPIGLSHYFCLVQAAAAVGFVKGLSGTQSVLWQRFTRRSPAPQTATPLSNAGSDSKGVSRAS
jgi:hypothetical protein